MPELRKRYGFAQGRLRHLLRLQELPRLQDNKALSQGYGLQMPALREKARHKDEQEQKDILFLRGLSELQLLMLGYPDR